MKTILVPIKTIERSNVMLQYAIDFASEINAALIVLHSYGEIRMANTISRVDKALKISAIDELKLLVESMDTKSVSITQYCSKGNMLDCIWELQQTEEIDLIVGKTRTNKLNQELYIGNFTGDMIQKIDCPIIIVPNNYVFKPIHTVFMAIKSGILRREDVLLPLHTMHSEFKVTLNLLQVITPYVKEKDLIINPELKNICSTFKTSENGTIFQGLLEHLNANYPDIICVIRRKKGFFENLWKDNSVKKEDFESRVPLLILQGDV
ncbi:MAG: universal stress protein UspA [Flavobacteriaceae bacterium]|nr:MAG: universal stress protein UspA [Flavobacteriaceae bacterium]